MVILGYGSVSKIPVYFGYFLVCVYVLYLSEAWTLEQVGRILLNTHCSNIDGMNYDIVQNTQNTVEWPFQMTRWR